MRRLLKPTAFRLKVQGYSQDSCKRSTYTVHFDEDGRVLKPRTIANSRQYGWGEWQTSEKVPCSYGDCWWVTTAGHGGFLLVTQQEDLPFKEPARKVQFSWSGRVFNFSVYEFEEDCDWALLEYADPTVRNYMRNRYNNWDTVIHKKSEAEWIQMVENTVRSWNPSFLNETQVA